MCMVNCDWLKNSQMEVSCTCSPVVGYHCPQLRRLCQTGRTAGTAGSVLVLAGTMRTVNLINLINMGFVYSRSEKQHLHLYTISGRTISLHDRFHYGNALKRPLEANFESLFIWLENFSFSNFPKLWNIDCKFPSLLR